jgi:FixJ family two-component response regulator
MSAYTRDTVVKAGRIEEDVDFLEKPFTAEHLAQRVGKLLSSRRGG